MNFQANRLTVGEGNQRDGQNSEGPAKYWQGNAAINRPHRWWAKTNRGNWLPALQATQLDHQPEDGSTRRIAGIFTASLEPFSGCPPKKANLVVLVKKYTIINGRSLCDPDSEESPGLINCEWMNAKFDSTSAKKDKASQREFPSKELAQYVAAALPTDRRVPRQVADRESDVDATTKLVYSAVRGLMQTISDSQRSLNETEPFMLAASDAAAPGSGFVDAVARAILFRVPVNIHKSGEFLSKLYNELYEAVVSGSIASEKWRIEVQSDGALLLHARPDQAETETRAPRKRASGIRFQSADSLASA